MHDVDSMEEGVRGDVVEGEGVGGGVGRGESWSWVWAGS